MPTKKQWEEEESEESSSFSEASSPAVAPVRRVNRFDDEEDQDDDVLESWDIDSDVEREKKKKEEEAKAAAAAAAAAKKKPKSERIAERKAERARREEDSSEEEEETDAQRRARLRKMEMESDLRNAEDLFADIGISGARKGTTAGTAVVLDPKNPEKTINLAKMPLFNPTTKAQFETLTQNLAPMLAEASKRPHYTLWLQDFCKQLAKGLPSDQVKKVASGLTTLANEKMREEKAAEKGGKKSKAQKTKTSLVTNRANAIEVDTYDDAFGDDDFM